jgi:hypothetical protein
MGTKNLGSRVARWTSEAMTSLIRHAVRPRFKSGLEEKIAKQIEDRGLDVIYERSRVYYMYPARRAEYRPDFILDNNIIIETKGIFDVADRQKHLLLKKQVDGLDIRFVFQRDNKLYKGSPTRYSQWCEKFLFKYAVGEIPDSWFKEPMGDRKHPHDLFPQSKPDPRTLRRRNPVLI